MVLKHATNIKINSYVLQITVTFKVFLNLLNEYVTGVDDKYVKFTSFRHLCESV